MERGVKQYIEILDGYGKLMCLLKLFDKMREYLD